MKTDEYFMKSALKEAKKALSEDEVPVGAVLVVDDKVICKAHNQKEKKLDVTSHAEIEVLRKGSKKLGTYVLDKATLYVTLEPCIMCAGAIKDSKIKRIVFGAADNDKGAIVSNYYVFNEPKLSWHPLITRGILEDECSKIIKLFFKEKR